jgi:benzoyl-CoA reductase/2-hydroxyglutaryl-CoA dehydratase subunit BcrC/BadD/HgdB
MDTVQEINRSFENQHVRAFRGSGGKVVGYTCVFTPVELLEAAGVMAYRIRAMGHTETDLADVRLSRFNCRFCRSCLQLGLDGTYDFLDGVVQSNGCDQLRGMYENWQYARAPAFFHYLKAPHLVSTDALDHFTFELGRLQTALETHFEVTITPDKLTDAMDRQRRIRRKLIALDALREQDRPAMTGSEALQVVLAGGSLPAAVYEELLDRLAVDCAHRHVDRSVVRLLLGGAASDEPALFATIEDFGGVVVADTLCFGARSYRPLLADTSTAEDPLRALAETYLGGSRCPRMYDEFEGRLAFVREAVEGARVAGVILVNNKFCDLHGFDNVLLRIRLEEQGVPVLCLEKEYGSPADHGRMRTRVQAFLERIGGRR